MKVNSCLNTVHANRLSNSVYKNNKIKSVSKISNIAQKLPTSVLISFQANSAKNLAQVASIAPEYQGPMNPVYKVGGLGNVAGEAAVAFQEHGGMDFRTFIPYYSPDNMPEGQTSNIKVRTPVNGATWQKPVFEGGRQVFKDGEPVFETVPAYEFKSVPIGYNLQDGEQFVIHEPVHTGREWNTGYKVLTDTGIAGKVKAINPDLTKAQDIPYRMFQIQGTGKDVLGNPAVYVIHTPELSAFPKAYGGDAYAGKFFDDYIYSIFSRASVDAIEQMDKEEFGHFNPGNFWLHDRQAFPAMMEMADRSALGDEYWRGIRAHASYHNPGRGYQGHYVNPIDFFRIVGTDDDLQELKKNPNDFNFVKQMSAKIDRVRAFGDGRFAPEEILTKEELDKLREIFDPMYGQFKDELGEYNLCKIPVVGIQKNPFNFTAGTVSRTYGKEMRNHNTREIAYGLTSDFAAVPTVDIVNGSSAKNLRLDIIGDFGKNNGFTEEVKQGFTPLTKDIVANEEALFAAKQSNKQWLIDTIAGVSGNQDSLARLFFNDGQRKANATVLGGMSPYKKGDVLFIGWGRPDTQKGFPTTLEGFLDFFRNPNVPEETKTHAKLILGAGPWPADSADWKTIQEQMAQIQALEGGKFKNNVCFLNGFFSNRIVACADYSNITSRYEPCGITPLESYAGATPVISNNTGGSPDFIQPLIKGEPVTNQTGFLTKNAYLVNPEVIGARTGITGAELDGARRIALGKENSECIEQAMDLFLTRPKEYKKLMMNAVTAKIDWHENARFNGGISALELYKQKAWAITPENKELTGQARNMDVIQSLKGKTKLNLFAQNPKPQLNETVQQTAKKGIFDKAKQWFNSKSLDKRYGIALVGIVAVAAVCYAAKRIFSKEK